MVPSVSETITRFSARLALLITVAVMTFEASASDSACTAKLFKLTYHNQVRLYLGPATP